MTRMKRGIRSRVVERRTAEWKRGAASDQMIGLPCARRRKAFPRLLRRIGYRDPETEKRYFHRMTNLRLAVRTIADINKLRWKVELPKQHLKMKCFIG